MNTVLPSFPRESLFTERSGLPSLLRHLLPAEAFAFLEPRLAVLGREVACQGIALGDTVDRHPPEHVPFDPLGNRVDQIVHHPAYRELERMSYGSGLIALKHDPDVQRRFPACAHQMGFSLTMVFGGAEAGLLCPLCMTDGVARVLQKHANPDLRARFLPHLTTTTVTQLWRGAMFLTEKQGGSDVGANSCRAEHGAQGWRLFGDKWFCSNVDAEALLVLARPDGSPPGTQGLGLFLVEAYLADGSRNGMVIHRLKDKLGVRSMATGEVTFTGATAHGIGDPCQGFKIMAEMINLSRLYNATVAVAILGRALEEVTHFALRRHAFGKRLVDHRMHLEALADLWAQQLGALSLVLSSAQQLDHSDHSHRDAWARVRLLTPMAKRHTGRLSVDGVSLCLELMGGQGYVEDTGMPRLLRDAQVLPIWEGTSHMQLWDIHRAAHKEEGIEPLRDWLHRKTQEPALTKRVDFLLDELHRVDADGFGVTGTRTVDALTNAVQRALLLGQGDARAILAARRLDQLAASVDGPPPPRWMEADLHSLCGISNGG